MKYDYDGVYLKEIVKDPGIAATLLQHFFPAGGERCDGPSVSELKGERMEFRKATMADLPGVARVYEETHDAEEAGRYHVNWKRGVYPTRETALEALERGDLFVMVDPAADPADQIVGTAVINQFQSEVYQNAAWEYPAKDSEVMVIHTLAIRTSLEGQGYGSAFMKFYEDYAMARGCPFLRMDTHPKNSRAIKLYKRLGYHETGIGSADFHGIGLVDSLMLEKKLDL